jgi:hypothetical protein
MTLKVLADARDGFRDVIVPEGLTFNDLMEATRFIPYLSQRAALLDLSDRCKATAKVYEHLKAAAARNLETTKDRLLAEGDF